MQGKTILVTGASAGFGAAIAAKFAENGWRVIACARRVERLAALVERFGSERVHPCAFDIRDEAALRRALDSLPEAFGDIDVLVNNAGLALGTARAQDCDLAQWRQMIDTNVTALVTLTRLLLPKLVERRGAIVNISSISGTYQYTGGDQAASDKLYKGAHPITAGDIADAAWWIANLPAHLNVNRLEMMPVSQSAAGLQVARQG